MNVNDRDDSRSLFYSTALAATAVMAMDTMVMVMDTMDMDIMVMGKVINIVIM